MVKMHKLTKGGQTIFPATMILPMVSAILYRWRLTGVILVSGKTDESTAEIMPYPDYVVYNAVQSVSLSDQEYDDVLSDFKINK